MKTSQKNSESVVTIFEAAVTAKVNAETAALQEAFESTLTEEVEQIKTELAEKVDDYLTYAAESWMKENALQIEHGIKTEMAESFFSASSLFYGAQFQCSRREVQPAGWNGR